MNYPYSDVIFGMLTLSAINIWNPFSDPCSRSRDTLFWFSAAGAGARNFLTSFLECWHHWLCKSVIRFPIRARVPEIHFFGSRPRGLGREIFLKSFLEWWRHQLSIFEIRFPIRARVPEMQFFGSRPGGLEREIFSDVIFGTLTSSAI